MPKIMYYFLCLRWECKVFLLECHCATDKIPYTECPSVSFRKALGNMANFAEDNSVDSVLVKCQTCIG